MQKLQEYIIQALVKLVQHDNDLIITQPKEECINHKLAQYLERVLDSHGFLDNRDVDIEYNKYKEDEKKSSEGQNIRPDIIVHERRSGNKNNLIVIEAKKNYDTKKDRAKVTDLVDSSQYQYEMGAVISYLPKQPYIKIKFFAPGRTWSKYRLDKKDFTLREVKI